MTQAFYNAISGINASQSQLVVVSDNIANMNTTGFKSSRVTFADVYYNTMSSGSPPTTETGGTNGKQIGLGVQIASIDRDFTNGTITSTGISTDCNIQGNGFFVVQGPSGENYYTRAGNFTVDSEGYLTLPNGYRVIGATNTFSTSASDAALQIPNMISTETIANTIDLEDKKLTDLNNCGITNGDFNIIATKDDGTQVTTNVVITENEKNLEDVINKIKTALNDNGIADEQFTISTADGKLSIKLLKPGTATDVDYIEFSAGSSNFVSTTELRRESSTSDVYSTKILDYKQKISAPESIASSQKYSSIAISETGVIEITYSNGDKLSVYANDLGLNEFKYTTSEGVIIKSNNDVLVSPSVLEKANLQIQLANFINPNGLVATGSNLYETGPNAGTAFFGTGNANAFGSVKTGGLEASNVDLATEFANMITAQRAVEANSRIFDTANQIMQTLVYLGS